MITIMAIAIATLDIATNMTAMGIVIKMRMMTTTTVTGIAMHTVRMRMLVTTMATAT